MEIYLAIIATLVGVLGLVLAIMQYDLNQKQRKDDLFTLRYKFYKQITKAWVKTHDKSNPPFNIIDLIPISEEAEFLFGKDISEHILSLDDKRASQPFFPDEDFSKSFRKYLMLR